MANQKVKDLVEKAFPYSSGEDRQDEAQKALEFVLDLIHTIKEIDKEEHPSATRTHYEWDIAFSRLHTLDLNEYLQIDPDIKRIMDGLDIDQDLAEKLVDEYNDVPSSLAEAVDREQLQKFDSKKDAFFYAHENLDKDDLLDLLYDENNHFDEQQYVELGYNLHFYWEGN